MERGFAELLGRFESGKITPEEFAREVMMLSGLNLPYHEFVEAWQDIFWLNEPVARLIALLDAEGYPLLLGSNTNVLHSAHYRRQFASTLDRFDHLVLSHEVGHMKPDAQFYEACVAAARPAGRVVHLRGRPLENVDRGSTGRPDRFALCRHAGLDRRPETTGGGCLTTLVSKNLCRTIRCLTSSIQRTNCY